MNKPPGAPLRIFHIDMNFVCLREDYLRQWLRILAGMGYNAVLWELEDKVQWETCPECVWPEAMTKDAFRSLLEYAAQLGLESIPLLQTIGHAEYVLKHAAYHGLREQADRHDCYCTTNPDVRVLLRRWIEEYLDLFASPRFFHLGGDEAYVFGTCPCCKAYADQHGVNALYTGHLADIATPIREKGGRAGIWCDMVLHYPDEMDSVPRDFVIWDWNYWSRGDDRTKTRIWGEGGITLDRVTEAHRLAFPELLDEDQSFRMFYTCDVLKRMGFDVILSSASRSAGDTVFLPAHDLHTRNILAASKKTIHTGLLGHCVTSWAIRLNPYETQAYAIGLAPFAMDRPEQEDNDLLRAYSRKLFGMRGETLLRAAQKLCVHIPFAGHGSTGIQWNRLKDSLPAPDGYLEGVLEQWKTDARPTWSERRESVRGAMESILEGWRLLACYMEDVPPSAAAYIETWSQAARLQYWQAYLGRMILEEKGGASAARLASRLKTECEAFLARAETPQSAAKNAGLVYDATIACLQKAQTIKGSMNG